MKKEREIRQRKKNRSLEKRIVAAKVKAKKQSEGRPHKFVKYATNEIFELYKKPEFCKNQDFLLYRYSRVERKDRIWTNLVLPLVLTFTISIEGIKALVDMGSSIFNVLALIPDVWKQMKVGQQVSTVASVLAIIGAVVITIRCVLSIGKMLTDSISRDAYTTIDENEMCIIRGILMNNGVLLDEEDIRQKLEDQNK